MKEFEAILAGISSRFLRAPLGEMDAAIGEALAAVSKIADVEQSHVYLFEADRETMKEIARWPLSERTRGDDPLRSIALDTLPFFSGELFSRRVVAFADVEEIPELSPKDRAFLARFGVRSCLSIPLTTAGETIGTLTLTTLTRRRAWSEKDTSLLRAAANVFAAALARREAEREQQEANKFARLITSLVSEFMNLPADGLDDGFERALETIARFVDCDRIALYILDESQEIARLYRGWGAPGAGPVTDDFRRVETTPDSLYGEWIHSERPHLILSAAAIAALRPEASEAIRKTRLGTVAILPLDIAGRRIGWFGVGAKAPRVHWNAAELRSLRLAANTLANMYSRRQSEMERRRHQELEDTLSELAADFIKRPPSEMRSGIEEIIDRFGRFAGCDRAAVLLIDPADETASTYYEWIGRGEPAPIRGFPVREAPWFYRQLMTSRAPWFMYLEEFPPSDRLAAQALEAIGVRTLLNCPLADGEHVFGYASIGYPKSGHRPVASTEQVLGVAAGIIASALSRDRLERQAVAQREALAHALRLGSLGQLATGIAHELNQPLAAIANYSRACIRWLDETDIDRDALAEILEHVSEEAIRAGGIIRNLRNHVKGGAKKRRDASVREIIEVACSLLAGTAHEHAVTILAECADPLPLVQVEPTEVGQVVINVVQNAIESIAAADSKVREVRIEARRKRAFVEVEIVDTGPGFGDVGRGKLFEQFYTTKPGGLGLGMSISRALIESNGGTIEVSDSSSGASIRLTLPVARTRRTRGRHETKGQPSAA